MSLLSDPDLLIHSLRLGYLRNVEDPYGARLISFNPSFSTNPYINVASLADPNKWPELTSPPSPPLSVSELGLKYTPTILGPSRTGGLGMSVNGRRLVSKPTRPIVIAASQDDNNNIPKPSPQDHARATADPPLKPVFIPKFKGAAEMDERRRLRIQVRRGSSLRRRRALPQSCYQETDEEEEDSFSPEDDVDFDDVVDVGVSVDIDGDEFDPEFATTRLEAALSDSVSDGLSGVSASLSASNSFSVISPHPLHSRSRSRLSPVTEGKPANAPAPSSSYPDAGARPSEPGFEMVTPRQEEEEASPGAPSHGAAEEDLFARQKVLPVRPAKSALSSMMAATNTTNPYSDLYSGISGRGVPPAASMAATVFFPFAREPAGKPMTLSVRKDATIEEVLGFALWSYWEEGWLPRLDEDPNAPEEKLSAVGWVLKIAEEDGEVDGDFPPPTRESKISKFNFEAYAVLEADATQVQQNKILESKIQRSPSRVAKTKKADVAVSALAAPTAVIVPSTSASALLPSTLSNSIFPGSYNPAGPQIFLRIRIQDTADAAHLYTTISVSATMYMQEALEMVCRRRKLQANEYALLLSDMSILIPLDRTVASLQGKSDLMLVKRSMLPHLNLDVRPFGRSTDPNASIFKRMSDAPDLDFNASQDFTAAYKKYTVYRKMPMIIGKQERTLAIDGPYIHIMPTANKAAKAVFDNGKTSSYHINSFFSCQTGKTPSSAFRFVVRRGDGGHKRYEFEAENPKLANEIVQTIKGLKSALERTGSITGKARRIKHLP
ncbi:stress-activated map kinase interacting protein 1-domain-containing protein [Lactarius akahatsu]|uniref:Stress-activated map kinase interacting protein 1-domain-containing protein n=1 Tax=Lactarius akahatsu TaxID=416441 RepID=A0AAD4LND2_9AGAM|nr:stress-activated map kinase interacting protein 1-domain-containing protein [Lactarius akahatsu]